MIEAQEESLRLISRLDGSTTFLLLSFCNETLSFNDEAFIKMTFNHLIYLGIRHLCYFYLLYTVYIIHSYNILKYRDKESPIGPPCPKRILEAPHLPCVIS